MEHLTITEVTSVPTMPVSEAISVRELDIKVYRVEDVSGATIGVMSGEDTLEKFKGEHHTWAKVYAHALDEWDKGTLVEPVNPLFKES